MKLAPVVLFVYCRPLHTRQTVEALLLNAEAVNSELFIYSDAPKNEATREGVEETRKYIHTISGFKSAHIIERERNWGLADSLIDGITHIVNEYGRIIVVEDDIVVSPYFLQYMNESLEIYENEERVACIHGYMYPSKKKLPETFFIKGADCWGWATWKRAWNIFNRDAKALLAEITERKLQREFDFNYTMPYVEMLKAQIRGEISSWAIRWYASAFLHGMYTLYPGQSMVKQIGMDGIGATHCSQTDCYEVEVRQSPILFENLKQPIKESEEGRQAFESFFKTFLLGKRYKIKRLVYLLKDYLYKTV